jgi:RNA polymerase sigma-70 factor (ECF subfamily)
VSTEREPPAPDAEAIWQEFHDGLLGFVRGRVRSREVAEDVVQDVMLRIHRQAAGIERADAVGAWVHQIARNAIIDHYRSARVRREVTTGEIDQDAADDSEVEGPDRRGELAACITPLLKRLPAKYREALVLTEVDGLSQADAAARAGVSLSGMKSRVQRARVQLMRVLVDCCEVDLDRRRNVTAYRVRGDGCGPCGCGGE